MDPGGIGLRGILVHGSSTRRTTWPSKKGGAEPASFPIEAALAQPDHNRTAKVLDRRGGHRRRSDAYDSAGEGTVHEAVLAILDKLNRGVFLLDGYGAIVFANRAADVMVARNDMLLVRRSRLQFKDPNANAAFQGFMANGDRALNGGSLVLRLDGPRLRHPYRVLVSLLVHQGRCDGGGLGYCVFIYEPNGGQRLVPLPVLRQLYRLTPGEARLANELFGGRSLAESASVIGVSINTARSVLKRVFTKCAVASQSELLLLLSLGPRTL